MKNPAILVVVFGLLALGSGSPLRADDLADCKSTVPERAITACTHLLTSETLPRHEQADAYYRRGVAYHRSKQEDFAIADFTQAIRLNPTHLRALNLRGFSYNSKHQYDLAIADFDALIKLDPRVWQAYVNRGLSYRRKGQLDQAISDFSTAIEINPDYAMSYNNRAYVYLDEGRAELAFADFDRALSLDPDNARIRHSLGDAYFRTGGPERAKVTWEAVCGLASTEIIESWQRKLSVVGHFGGPITGSCDSTLLEAFLSCARVNCAM